MLSGVRSGDLKEVVFVDVRDGVVFGRLAVGAK
jgi:hypothetical protein